MDRTIALGAKALTGGHAIDRPGYFNPATVLVDVPPDAPVLGEEILEPVARSSPSPTRTR